MAIFHCYVKLPEGTQIYESPLRISPPHPYLLRSVPLHPILPRPLRSGGNPPILAAESRWIHIRHGIVQKYDGGKNSYPLVNIQKAIENGHL